MQTIIFTFLSLAATLAVAQQPTTRATPAVTATPDQAYTPDPVSTTYRALTGRLFFSDAQRERLNKARRDGVQIVDGKVIPRAPQLNGFVKRSDGRTTYWVDGGQRTNSGASTKFEVASSMTGAEPGVTFLPSTAPRTEPTAPTIKAAKPPRATPRQPVAPAKPVAKQ